MKSLKFLLIFLFLFACKETIPVVVFEKPLPENKSNINFPQTKFGDYYNIDNEETLTINEKFVLRKKIIKDTIGLSLKNEFEKNDSIKEYFHNIQFSKLSDTMFLMTSNKIDTIFNLNKGDVLRKLKGHYILNHKYDENYYIQKMTFKTGMLNIQQVDSIEILNDLKIINEPIDSLSFPVKAFPTKKQFKQLIKSKGFNQGETYLKVKN
jgi:hypothetical protein